ncbi:S53 family peptidase [Nevskia soli]|uniref:S53 family peptidase n=1 Tax=Nevskia soli TaxID=418856 RepID=UPI000A074E35|nr:S53 family peptidase [Nevskia soli]
MTATRFGRSRPAIALAIGIAALSCGASAQAAWHATSSKAHVLENAVELGALPASRTLHVAIGLKLQNEAALDAFLVRQHTLGFRDYGTALSSEEFTGTYAVTPRQAQTVVDYLVRAGFQNVTVAANRLLITADARPSQIEAAFNTRLAQFKLGNRQVFANKADVSIPDALNGLVTAVLGLQNADLAQPMIEYPAAATQASTAGHVPTAFAAIYNATSVATGSATDIGIVTDGNLTQTVADLRTFESQNGLTPVNLVFRPAEINGTDTSGLDEWDLDSQSSTGIAGTVKDIYFYNAASLGDADLTAAYNLAVSDNKVKAVNVSLGICEKSSNSSGEMATDDLIFKSASALGITFFVSSGDGGYKTGCSGHTGLVKAVSYPASSPYVVAVGGTTLSTSGNVWAGETAWKSGGGGVSVYETAQPYQQSVTGSAKREVPDVAMDADPNSGALVIVNGASAQIGGTSLSAPLSTGTWARVQSSHGNSLGFAAPLLYAAAGKTPAPYHDVTSGNNGLPLLGGYSAKAGFDETTGWGTFDIASFNTVVGH